MHFEGLSELDQSGRYRWARYSAKPGEIETATLGYLAIGDKESLRHLPTEASIRDGTTYLNREMARRIVAGNVLLLNKMSVSQSLREGQSFADVSEFVESGVQALQWGADEPTAPIAKTE